MRARERDGERWREKESAHVLACDREGAKERVRKSHRERTRERENIKYVFIRDDE